MGKQFGRIVEIWSLYLKVRILVLLLSLILVSCAKTSQIEQPFAGNYRTETIRQLWQMCSLSHQGAKIPQHIYYPICDCAVDTMRENYDNATILTEVDKKTSDELSVLIRLNCNSWRKG